MSKKLCIKGHTITGDKAMVCVPVVSSTKDSIIKEVTSYVEKKVPMIELRMDFYEDLNDDNKILSLLEEVGALCSNTVVLFTIRTSDEGGEVSINNDEFSKIILLASRSGHIDMVDCEIDKLEEPDKLIDEVHKTGVYVVASHHNFNHSYEGSVVKNIFKRMYDAGADIQKIALMPTSKIDTLDLLKATIEYGESNSDALTVAISMGKDGRLSRVAGGFVGSCITFSSIAAASAPGQIGFDDINTVLNILEV